MKKLVRKYVNKILPGKLKLYLSNFILGDYTSNSLLEFSNSNSFAQEGEDLILARLFMNKRNGFFIDIGAHHPRRFSNTYYFYKLGWRGINIDAMPGSMKLFNAIRPEDINIQVPISSRDESILFYIFKESALNTFDANLALKYIEDGWELESKITLSTKTLSSILSKYRPKNQKIDFISIDVEGLELDVLNSFDWNSELPTAFIIEDQNFDHKDLMKNVIYNFMTNKNYNLFSKLYYSTIYLQNDNKQ